ncbi:MAG: ATP-binding protein [Bacilli bacterium]|nr:ATP-binding protein [Bacilli bacterium]
MERKISEYLQKWKNDIIRKPLLVYGPKQIGKTCTVLEFAKKEYKNIIYFNTENNIELINIFKKEKSISRIILNLSLLSGETILENDTLIVFDNVNNNDIVKGVKVFGSSMSKYHIIMITSRRENLATFKGEELQYKSMNELDFEEYLWAREERQLSNLIRESFDNKKTCPFHKVALDLFFEYLETGGFPEVVISQKNGEPKERLEAIKQKILDTYKKEISINKNLIDIQRSLEIIDSIPYQLKKDNKKFQYGLIGKGRRAKEFESAITYLVNNQLIYRSYKVKEVKSPLSSCKEKDSFKLYINNEGLLFSMLNMKSKDFLINDTLKETIYENHIAKTLAQLGYSLYYYQSDGKAEVNFVIQNRMGKIIPIEIATKTMSKAKSLSVFMKRFTVIEGLRITENNFSTKKDIRYLPIYAIFCLGDLKI